jgi:hypothetical protein
MGTVDVELDPLNSDTYPSLRPGGLVVLQRPTAGRRSYARGGMFRVRVRPAPLFTVRLETLEVHYALCPDGEMDDS